MPLGGICVRVISASLLFPLVCLAGSETDFYDQAVGLMGQHKYAEAEAAFRQSIHADPRYKEAWDGLAQALKAEGKDASAVEKMAILTTAVVYRLACTVPIVNRTKASSTMMTIHCGNEITASLRRIRFRLACSTCSMAVTA